MRYLLLLTIFFTSCSENIQDNSLSKNEEIEKTPSPYFDLRNNADLKKTQIKDTMRDFFITEDTTGYLNYTKVLLRCWKLSKTKKINEQFMDHVMQGFSYVGDVETVLRLSKSDIPGDTIVAEEFFKKYYASLKLKTFDPKELILEKFKTNDIVMLNEAHDRPQTRTFLLSILEDLKVSGVKNLALETFQEMGNFKELYNNTGCYTNEPINGQLVREALKLGFKLVHYEINSKNGIMDRELAQAKNLFEGIKTKTGVEKTILLAGYSHIGEASLSPDYKMMATWFKEISGIDPVTINQEYLVEYHAGDPKARKILERLLHPAKAIAIEGADARLFVRHDYIHSEDLKKIPVEHDYYIYLPYTKFFHNRPDWMLTNIGNEFQSVEIPKNIKPVLVQAYVLKEIKTDKDYLTRVPYDQTFSSEKGNAWLALKKGDKYIVIFRGENNEILLKKEIKA